MSLSRRSGGSSGTGMVGLAGVVQLVHMANCGWFGVSCGYGANRAGCVVTFAFRPCQTAARISVVENYGQWGHDALMLRLQRSGNRARGRCGWCSVKALFEPCSLSRRLHGYHGAHGTYLIWVSRCTWYSDVSNMGVMVHVLLWRGLLSSSDLALLTLVIVSTCWRSDKPLKSVVLRISRVTTKFKQLNV